MTPTLALLAALCTLDGGATYFTPRNGHCNVLDAPYPIRPPIACPARRGISVAPNGSYVCVARAAE